jgi:hypothetical protein
LVNEIIKDSGETKLAADLRNTGDAAQIGKNHLYSIANIHGNGWNIAFKPVNPNFLILHYLKF